MLPLKGVRIFPRPSNFLRIVFGGPASDLCENTTVAEEICVGAPPFVHFKGWGLDSTAGNVEMDGPKSPPPLQKPQGHGARLFARVVFGELFSGQGFSPAIIWLFECGFSR